MTLMVCIEEQVEAEGVVFRVKLVASGEELRSRSRLATVGEQHDNDNFSDVLRTLTNYFKVKKDLKTLNFVQIHEL